MAAVVRTILASRDKNSSSAAPLSELVQDDDYGPMWDGKKDTPLDKPRGENTVRVKPSSAAIRSKQRVEAVMTIQRWYRGAKVRTYFKKVFGQVTLLSSRSVNKILLRVIVTHHGWGEFILNLVWLSLFMAMIIVQVTYSQPTGSDVDQSLISVVNTAEFDPVTGVTRSQQVFDYVESLLPVFASAANPATAPINETDRTAGYTAECEDVAKRYCNVDNTSDSNYIHYLELISSCLNNQSRYDHGYLDNQNRLQFGIFITQHRYGTAVCNQKVQVKNPLNRLPRHACLAANSDVNVYDSEICGTASAPNTANDCYRFPEFHFNNITQSFTAVIATGNLGDEFGIDLSICRLNKLRELGWLDYRTKQTCLFFFTFNENENGRLAVFRNCFDFTLGGKVYYQRDIASVSVGDSRDPTVVGVTGAFAAMLCLVGIWEVWDIALYYKRSKGRMPRSDDLVAIVLIALSIASLATFFPLYNTTIGFVYSGSGDLSQFASPNLFWSSMLRFFHLLGQWQSYYTLLAITMFVFIIRMLLVLDFHPSIGIISGTLKIAAKELMTFLLVYTIILISYSCLGIMFFGPNFPQFSTLGTAMMSLIFISFMQLEDVGLMVLDPTISIGIFEGSNWIVVLWYYSFIVLVSLLLFNVLLSIVVGAFVEFQERRKERTEHFGLFATFFISMNIWGRWFCGICILFCERVTCGRFSCRRRTPFSNQSKQPGPQVKQQSTTTVKKPDDGDVVASGDEEKGDKQGIDRVPFGDDKLNPYDVIVSLNMIRARYANRKAAGLEIRKSLSIIFSDSTVVDRLISEMRQITIRENYTPEVLSFKAKHFKEEQYKSHMLTLVQKVLALSNASAVAASAGYKEPIEHELATEHAIEEENQSSKTET